MIYIQVTLKVGVTAQSPKLNSYALVLYLDRWPLDYNRYCKQPKDCVLD